MADLSDLFGVDMEAPIKPTRKKRAVSKKVISRKKSVKKKVIKKTLTGKKKKKPFTPTAAAVTRLRKRFKMNASQFAKLVGVSPPTVGNWEKGSGKLNLRQHTLNALSRTAKLTPEQATRRLKRS